jgi:tRNA-specific 2-thiouridylase
MLAGVDIARLEHHLESPQGFRQRPAGSVAGTAGGAACCDHIDVRLTVERDRVTAAGFDASGCGTALAAGSAVVALSRGRGVLEVGLIGPLQIAAELGGLSPGKLHAADLAADALHRALGMAARERAALAPTGSTLVAMSGGVDSAVAALLTERSNEAVAVTLELWADPENDGERSCCSASAVRSARAIAHELGLPHFTLDLRDEFRAGVVEPFVAGYAAGETPNPCVRCNGNVRLDAMLALADRLGCRHLATGHYARTAEDDHAAGPLLRLAADPAKDQTYMLAALDPSSLSRMRFPLGELTKPEVRQIAADAGLTVAGKAESQDLCFLAGTDRARFLARHGDISSRAGEIVDRAGTVLGRHRGQHHFTVGQRKGIGVASGRP